MNYIDDHPREPIPLTANHSKYDKFEAERQLTQAISGAHEVLASATTVFPFTLFPDTITVDRTKLTVTHRTFFSMAEVTSINIEDILNVVANVGPFFGSLVISTRFFDVKKPYEVNWLWRNDALRIARIMHGYIIAVQHKIDCSALSTNELSAQLDELGKEGQV